MIKNDSDQNFINILMITITQRAETMAGGVTCPATSRNYRVTELQNLIRVHEENVTTNP